MGYADLHIHSLYSYDAATTVRAILKHAAMATVPGSLRSSLDKHQDRQLRRNASLVAAGSRAMK